MSKLAEYSFCKAGNFTSHVDLVEANRRDKIRKFYKENKNHISKSVGIIYANGRKLGNGTVYDCFIDRFTSEDGVNLRKLSSKFTETTTQKLPYQIVLL